MINDNNELNIFAGVFMTDTFTSSTSTDDNQGHLVEVLMSQVDDEAIATIIRLQKKS